MKPPAGLEPGSSVPEADAALPVEAYIYFYLLQELPAWGRFLKQVGSPNWPSLT
jgi:hypothetical protein